jgi:hypothetical protein
MSRRRFVNSHNVVNFHDWTPQKGRSVMSENAFQPTNLYRKNIYKPESSSDGLDAVQESWIGKYFIPDGSQPKHPERDNYVLEREIANYLRQRRWQYQVLFVGRPNAGKYMARGTGIDVVSKPDVLYKPSRMNIFVTTDDKIQKIEFF